MRLEIAERLRPFSHLPGTAFLLPGTALSVAVYPTLLRIHDLANAKRLLLAEITCNLKGPIEGFTSILDLEKGELRIFGTSQQGYFRYHLKAINESAGIALHVEKVPHHPLCFQSGGIWQAQQATMQAGDTLLIGSKVENTLSSETTSSSTSTLERLSLGNHKQQDWELVRRRLSFDEIFPIWHRLGQLVPGIPSKKHQGTALLLDQCRERIAANAPEKILESFRALFLAGFEGVLSPRLMDTDFNGICLPYEKFLLSDGGEGVSPIVLLTEGAALIRSLFIQEELQTIRPLPALPPEFHCGRFLNVRCGEEGMMNLEWTKKSIRRMTFSAAKHQTLSFYFSNNETKCRLRSGYEDRGIVYIPGSPLEIVPDRQYWFDRFQR